LGKDKGNHFIGLWFAFQLEINIPYHFMTNTEWGGSINVEVELSADSRQSGTGQVPGPAGHVQKNRTVF
jgi:hypothetical protein